jgi:glycerophosphoryl diester phosphodiesterase
MDDDLSAPGDLGRPGEHGGGVGGPPWILGHRGAPREAPENTLSGLRLALDLGLDGVEYDVHACATGEPLLIHDETLERTTDGHGPVSELTLPELSGLDAGGWFHREFRGEPLPLLEEALVLPGGVPGQRPLHMIEVKDPSVVAEVARELSQLPEPLGVRLASFHRAACLEAREAGLAAMLLAVEATEDDRRFVRDERIAAHGVAPGGWDTAAGGAEWDCERWGWSIDAPADLLAACRLPLFGFNTNEPRRALAARALVRLAPGCERWPLETPELEVGGPGPGHLAPPQRGVHGEWSGRWDVVLRLANPFVHPVRVAADLLLRGGAFEASGMPVAFELGPRDEVAVPLTLAGGSWSPGEDPLVVARFDWEAGPGRRAGGLVFDTPLARTRSASLGDEALRVPMLCEHPGQPQASMTLRRRGGELRARIEHDGGARDARAVVRLGHVTHRGGRGVRVPLPATFHRDGRPLPFSVGFEGRGADGERLLRRWCGGLPPGLRAGAPGWLFRKGES